MADKSASKAKADTHDDPEQSKRFIEAAKEHGAADDEEAAQKAFRKVVGPKRSGTPAKPSGR